MDRICHNVSHMQNWEYLAHLQQFGFNGGRGLGIELEHLGTDGWELVAVVPFGLDGTHAMCYFKRPRS